MKRCPNCNRTYTDLSLNFCLEDGTPLVSEVAAPPELNPTVRYQAPRNTNEPPPPTEIYRPSPLVNKLRGPAQPPQWAPITPALVGPGTPRRKSNAIWWILGGLAVVAIIGIGLMVMILALASMSSKTNENATNANGNNRVVRSNGNTPNANIHSDSDTDSNKSAALPSSLTDDFSTVKWGTGTYKFGDIWYADDEYHLRSKAKTFLVMYAPTNDYNTENATVKVTARSVDGTVPSSGYGLIVHGERTKDGELEDYALLIYTGDEPQYEVVMHKTGHQSTLVPWTKSGVIRSGTNLNRLEVRVKGTDLSFYINGQYLTHVTDTENFKRGRAGFYTSDTSDVAFDDLEIQR